MIFNFKGGIIMDKSTVRWCIAFSLSGMGCFVSSLAFAIPEIPTGGFQRLIEKSSYIVQVDNQKMDGILAIKGSSSTHSELLNSEDKDQGLDMSLGESGSLIIERTADGNKTFSKWYHSASEGKPQFKNMAIIIQDRLKHPILKMDLSNVSPVRYTDKSSRRRESLEVKYENINFDLLSFRNVE